MITIDNPYNLIYTKMRKILIMLSVFILWVGVMNAQNNNSYTMFMWNKIQYNPAYAGSKERMVLDAHYRHQWHNLEGAPKTVTLNMHTPFFNDKCGAGISLMLDQIGLTQSLAVTVPYSYRVQLGGNNVLSFGLQARFENTRFKWNEATPIEEIDDLVNFSDDQNNNLNFGGGIWYNTRTFYAGISMPQFLQNSEFTNSAKTLGAANPYRPIYFMTGKAFQLSDNLVLKPAVLISYIPNAPLDFDLNANFLFMNKVWLGASYRWDDSVDFLAQYLINNQLSMGLAIDFTTSELRRYNDGSYEVMLEYLFNKKGEQLENLRFF